MACDSLQTKESPRATSPDTGKGVGAQAWHAAELASVENQSLQGGRVATARSWEFRLACRLASRCGEAQGQSPSCLLHGPGPQWATRNSRLDSTSSAATTSTPSQAQKGDPRPAPSADCHFSIAWKLGQKSDLSAPALVATLGLPLKIHGIFLRIRSYEQDSALL